MQIEKSHFDANGNTVYPKGWIPFDSKSPNGLAQQPQGYTPSSNSNPGFQPPPSPPAGDKAPASSGSADKRQMPCPDCTGKQLTNPKKKEAKTLEHLFPKMNAQVRNFLGDALSILGLDKTKDKKSLFDKQCPTCGGKSQIDDPSDRSKQIQKTKQAADSAKDELTKLESKMGPTGGNRTTIVVGNDMLQVGLAYNDSPSYKILKDKAIAPAGTSIESKAPMKVSQKINAVVGTNPLPTLGGNYTIQCGNKFTVRSGAQGIELSTEGPLTIKAGITQFIGPEITIGSSVGQVIVEGQHLQLNGKSVAITPGSDGKGQVSVQGTMHTTGNIVAQGGAHIEGDLSFISATAPSKLERTKHGSHDVQTTGAAYWEAECAQQALQDYQRIRMGRLTDPAGVALSVREILNVVSETKDLIKKAIPVEAMPTGIIQIGTPVLLTGACPCNQGGTASGQIVATVTAPIPLYNFPHHHILPDTVHTHDNLVPNFNLLENDEAVRKAAKGKDTIAPVQAATGGKNPFLVAWSGIQGAMAAIGAKRIV